MQTAQAAELATLSDISAPHSLLINASSCPSARPPAAIACSDCRYETSEKQIISNLKVRPPRASTVV